MALITYSHANSTDGPRYRQYSADPLPVWAVDVQLDIESYPLLERHIMDFQNDVLAEDDCVLTFDEALAAVYEGFERLGPFHYAKTYGLLVNNSGEEFAVQFMTIYNYSHPGTY